MAKNKERRIAQEMYVFQLKTAKEIATVLQVQEKTVGDWVKKGSWLQQRDAKVNSASNGRETIKQVIANIAERRVELNQERKDSVEKNDKTAIVRCDMESASLADQVSKMNAALRSFDHTNRITITIYLEVMEDIFNSLRVFNETLHLQTIDFQESHAQHICKKIG